MEYYETDVRVVESGLPPVPPASPVVFYGSSSIRMWSNLAGDLNESGVLNLGFGGSTLAACVHYFERLVVPYQPRSLVVYAGDNDIGDGARPLNVLASLRLLLEKSERYLGVIPFTFLSIKVSPARWHLREVIRETNSLAEKEMAARRCCSYVDVAQALLGPDGQPQRSLFCDDGLHLSPSGYRVWSQILRRNRERIFTRHSCNGDK